jgi:hypothetical protein
MFPDSSDHMSGAKGHIVLRNFLAQIQRFRPYFPHVAALGVAIVLGIAVSLFTISGTPPAVDTKDRWPLPKWAPYRAGEQREELKKLAIWAIEPGKEKIEAVKKPEGPPWRFIGTLQTPKGRIAVIEIDKGKRTQLVLGGEPLPNGVLIKNVGVGELVYDEDGVEKVLTLFSVDKAGNLPAENRKK